MKRVAKHLRDQAVAMGGGEEADLYARSSINRYYYSAYLIVRDGLRSLESKWAGNIPHAMIPEMLRKQIKRELSKQKDKALKIEDRELLRTLELSINAARSLATLMEEGRFARVAADYEPDIRVEFNGPDGFSLNSVSVEQAKAWPEKAEIWMNQILTAWRQVHD